MSAVIEELGPVGYNCCKIKLALIWVTMTGATQSPGHVGEKKENHLRSGLLPYTTITLYQIKRPESVSSLQSVSTSCQNLTSHLLKVIVIV